MTKCEIISIGDELLIGQVVNTNASWMAKLLESESFKIVRVTTIADFFIDIYKAFDEAFSRADVVLVTGGIGPTKDDITKHCMCQYFDSELIFSEEVYQNIQHIYCLKGRSMNDLTRNQAMVPDKATILQNRVGTAPICWFERDGKVLVSMPGVPTEMKWAMENAVIPRLKEFFPAEQSIAHRSLLVSGITESSLAEHLEKFEQELPKSAGLAYLPQMGIIRLRLTVENEDSLTTMAIMKLYFEKLLKEVKPWLLSDKDCLLEEFIGDLLRKHKLRVVTAESCTGGKIAARLTSVPGSSDYVEGGIISYSNQLKNKLLSVSSYDLERYGAVSRQVVEAMAQGAILTTGANCSVATSGIAGPGGGSLEKPVGTVWIAATCLGKTHSELFKFNGTREQITERAVTQALLMLIGLIKKMEE